MTSWIEVAKKKAKLGKWINQELGTNLPWGSILRLRDMQKLKKEIEKRKAVHPAEIR